MADDKPRKSKAFNRRVRSEVVRINGVPVKFYRDGRRWHWRAIGGRIQLQSKAG